MENFKLYIDSKFLITLFIIVSLLIIVIYCLFYRKQNETFSIEEPDAATITMYHVDWCGYCKKAMPEFKKLKEYHGQIINDSILHVKIVDCDEETELAEKENITSFPTIKLEHKSKTHEYDGERTFKGFMDFLKKKM